MALTIRGSYADIFWFSLFHELGHIVNNDITKTQKFIDILEQGQTPHEIEANRFATNALINPDDYNKFLHIGDFSINALQKFSKTQNIKPYIVIGRLQKEKRIPYNRFSDFKPRYKWSRQ